MDIATLGLKIENSPVDKAADSLDRLSASAGKAEKSSADMGRSADRAGNQASAANQKAASTAKQLDRAYADVGKSVLSAAKSMLIIVGASVGASAIVNTLANFEQSMSSVAAVTRASAEEMTALRNVAKELGATTEFSASQAAEALTFLGMAGFSASESMSAIPAVLDLATAATLDLASAADITSNIMSGFGISARNAADVADVLAAASSRSNTSVSQLGQAMSTVAPIAGALDISLADTAAAIGVLSDAGIQSGRAGTALRGVLAALSKPSKEAATALKSMGLSINDINPDTNDLADVLDRLQKAGLGTADAMTIFGREAASGALVLVNAADRVREFGGELTDVAGDAKLMADIMRDNLKGDLLGVASAVEGLIIALGEAGITSILRTVAQSITTVVRATSGFVDILSSVAQAITGYLQPAFDAVKQYADIAVAALAGFYAPVVLGGFVALTAAVRSLTVSLGVGLVGAIRAVTAAMLANPIGLIIAGLAAAGVAAYKFSVRFREFVGEDVVGTAKTAANYVIGSFVAAYEDIKFVWSNFGDIMGGSVVGGVNVAIRAINRLIQGSLSGINSLIDAVNEIPGIDIGRIGQNAGIEELANPYAERLTASVEERNKKIAEALSKDYFGGAADALFPDSDAPAADKLDADKITSGALGGGGKASKELQRNIDAIKSLEQALYLAGLKGEELAVAQARLSLNEYASPEQIAQVEKLGSEIFKVQERMARINKFGEGVDADKFILGNVSPLTGGAFDDQFARYQAEEDAEKERYQSQLDRLVEARELQIETQRSYDELEAAAAQQHSDRMAQIDQARSTMSITTAGNMFGTLANMLKTAGKEQSALYKGLFLMQQAAAIANAIVSTEEGAAKALGLGPFGIPLSGLIRASGYASVAAIAAQTITGMAHDGIDSVPQTGTWLLEKGERVTTANTSAKMDSVLERIDAGMRSNRSGGASNQEMPKVTVNIQNAPEGTVVEQRQLDDEYIIDVIMNDMNADGDFSRLGQNQFGWVRQGT